MNKRLFCTATLLALGAFLPSAASAGFLDAQLFIDDRGEDIAFQVDNFDGGFSVNGNQIQFAFANQQTASYPESTPGGDPLVYSFNGYWSNATPSSSFSQTVVFLEGDGSVSDILTYAYVYNGIYAVVTGTFVSDVDGGTPLALPAGDYVSVNGEFYDFSSSGIVASADSTPEPGTLRMVLIGLSLAAVPVLRRKSDHPSGGRD